ncbi:MAG: VOC family protein [Candidatus Delongbacteria bacterium]|nr:VOC family protein [Candidatus Delongbacteria bacterium]
MKKVKGIGGIFFKCKDPDKVKKWYNKHLGLQTDEYGTNFVSRDDENPDEKTFLQWSPFSDKTDYFSPGEKDFMINYRVNDLTALMKELKAEGVKIIHDIKVYDYGKFAQIMDIEGNQIELWEPCAAEYEKMVKEEKSEK